MTQALPTSRQALIDQCDELAAQIPELLAQHPEPGDFMVAFAGVAEEIEEAAHALDRAEGAGSVNAAYVNNRLAEMLDAHSVEHQIDRMEVPAG